MQLCREETHRCMDACKLQRLLEKDAGERKIETIGEMAI